MKFILTTSLSTKYDEYQTNNQNKKFIFKQSNSIIMSNFKLSLKLFLFINIRNIFIYVI
jgi:hypothetical protein